MILALSRLCLVLLYALSTGMALVAAHKEAARATAVFHPPRWAFRLLADALERAGRPADAATELEKELPMLRVERYRRTLGERAQGLRDRNGRENS